MHKTVLFGYGNVGRAVADTLQVSEDLSLTGIVDPLVAGSVAHGLNVVATAEELESFDVAILALPSRVVPQVAADLLAQGVSTVDSFDIHSNIPELRKQLHDIACANNVASIIASGWDPGTDSIIRTVFQAMAPRGITYTNFGPGMSMGHSVAAKAVPGVKDALSMTIPAGAGVHRRMVYIVLEEGYESPEVIESIKQDDYFAHDDTYIECVNNIDDILDVGHGVHMVHKGVSGVTHNQLFEYEMKINNPALTAQVLVSSTRAVLRQPPGCYTLIEIPPVDFLQQSREEAVKALV